MFKIIFAVDNDINFFMSIRTNIILVILSKSPLILLQLGNFSIEF